MSTKLKIHYEGYWQCRQATDPDPSRDKRGASGYTFAIGEENDLDEIIRLHLDEIPEVDRRKAWPPPSYPKSHALACENESENRFGIFVNAVELDGRRYEQGEQALGGGKVRWLPQGDPKKGPRFELRNTLIFNPGNNSGIFMPVDPFHIQIEGKGDAPVKIGRDDPLNPDDPKEQIWEISDSEIYKRRCPRDFYSDSDEALTAIGVDKTSSGGKPYLKYFQQRKEWLELELTDVEREIAKLRTHAGDETEIAKLETKIAKLEVQRGAYLNRLYVIQEFTPSTVGDRLGTRLGLMARWEHDLLGNDITLEGTGSLGGTVLTGPKDEWRVGYWMGAFDGDTMRGYMRGYLDLPFEVNDTRNVS